MTPEELGKKGLNSLISPVIEEMDKQGLTLKKLVSKLKQELNAKTTKTQKIKGSPQGLPKKFRLITTTGIIETTKGENGTERDFSDGESLIQWDETDNTTRQKARMDAHKLRGDYPAEKLEHSGLEGGPIRIKRVSSED